MTVLARKHSTVLLSSVLKASVTVAQFARYFCYPFVLFVDYLPFITLVAAVGITMSAKDEATDDYGGAKPKIPSHAPDEKGAIGGHEVKTETTSTPPQEGTGAMINELISAMTQVFKQSSDKPSSGDSISRNVALKQPKPYSLGQNFKVWLSQFDEYSKLASIPESKKKAFLVTLLDQTAYRAVQLLRIPESASYQVFLQRVMTRFDSGKSPGDYKLLLRARQQDSNEDFEMYTDNLLELAENAYPDADYRFKEEIAKDRFLEGVRCSDGCREQLFIKQPESLSAAVRLVRQLESARVASRNSAENKPPRPQLNVMEENNTLEVSELKGLMASINSRLERLEKQQREPRRRPVAGSSRVRCYRCQNYGHYARDCLSSSGNGQRGLPRVNQSP